MKKIFTLISMAFLAMSVNAQVIWKAADYDLSNAVVTDLTEGVYGAGTEEAPDRSVPGSLKTSIITVEKECVTMTGVSTPNSLSKEDIEKGKTLVFWELKGSVDGNDALITDDCTPQFAQYLIAPNGNPEFEHWEFYEKTEDGGEAFRAHGTPWEIGATEMPAKGAYYKFTSTQNGAIRVAIYGNKNTNPTYIVDEETKQPLDPATVGVSIYYQNTGFAYEGKEEDEEAGGADTRKYFNVGTMAEDYVLQHTNGITQNRPVLGYIDFNMVAGKTYWMFNPQSQIGIYGFYFAADDTDGIANVETNVDNANAPVYNLAGQRVSNDTKGLLIKNGKKFINK